MALTEAKIKTAEPIDKLYTLWDEQGLYIEVSPTGSKRWRVKYTINGKDARQSLGIWPHVTLLDARQRRDDVKRMLAQGIDPAKNRREAKQASQERQSNTVIVIGEKWLAKWQEGKAPRTVSKVASLLNRFVYPVIGDLPIGDVTAKRLLADVLEPLEAQGLRETVHQVKRRMGQLLRYGAVLTDQGSDVTVNLKGLLIPVRAVSHAAITDPVKLIPLVQGVWNYQGRPRMQSALKLLALTWPRPGMLRHMEWSEVSFTDQVWAIPAEKMKMRNAHIIPLSTQAVDILDQIKQSTGCYKYVFPNERGCAFPMSNAALNNAHTRMGFDQTQHVPHGWRATARTIIAEHLGYSRSVEWIELQLAHEVKDPNGRAYNRTAFLPQRREMMQKWADYLDELRGAV